MHRHLSRGFLVAVLAIWTALSPASAQEKPNIIVIMADDLGYGDISANGATALSTPAIDSLASEGLRFTSGYCSASTCTPTRWSLLTGTYAFRDSNTGIASPNAPAKILPGTVTIASLLKQAGYTTAVIGKWHLGLGVGAPDWNGVLRPGPLDIGFDYCFLLPTTNDRVPQVFVENDTVLNLDPNDPLIVSTRKNDVPPHPTGADNPELLRLIPTSGHNGTIHNGISRIGFYVGGNAARFRDEDLSDEWAARSIQWMTDNRDGPFFLFIASHDNHVPRMPHERFQGLTPLGLRGDAILELDDLVGQIKQAVIDLQIENNTLIIFCSDNGPVIDDGYLDYINFPSHAAAGPYRGGKYSVWEGGTRTPFITWWPGRIQPGVSDEIVSTVDLAASLASLTGVPLPDSASLDSFNVMGALLGDPNASGRDHLVQQNNQGNRKGLRVGNWKLVRDGNDRLYDLSTDPGETTNVAGQNPDQLSQMQALLGQIISQGRSRPADPNNQITNQALIVSGPNDRIDRYGLTVAGDWVFQETFLEGPVDGTTLEPFSIVQDPNNGDLIVCERDDTMRLLRFDEDGAFIEELGRNGNGFNGRPAFLTIDPGTGDLFFTKRDDPHDIVKYVAASQTFIDPFIAENDTGGAWSGSNWRGITVSPDGRLFVADQVGNQILEFNAVTGSFVQVLDTPNAPLGIYWDAVDGRLITAINTNAGQTDDVLAYPGGATPAVTLLDQANERFETHAIARRGDDIFLAAFATDTVKKIVDTSTVQTVTVNTQGPVGMFVLQDILRFENTLQAEEAALLNAVPKDIGVNWNGTGFVDLGIDGYVEWTVNVRCPGNYDLLFNVAGNMDGLAAEISVNGIVVNPSLPCPNTGSWNSVWEIVTEFGVKLNAGSNIVRFKDSGINEPQVDQLEIVPSSIPVPGDCDGDGYLLADTDGLQALDCLGGAGVTPASECECSDTDGENDIDLADLANIQQAVVGASPCL